MTAILMVDAPNAQHRARDTKPEPVATRIYSLHI
jgi:hypothetical protein